MKLTCEGADLKAAIRKARAVVPSKSKIPVIGTVRVTAAGDRAELAGTDMDISVRAKVAATVDAEGAWCFESGLLAAAIDACPDGAQVMIEVKDGKALIRHSAMKTRAVALPGADWPELDPGPDAWSVTMAGGELAGAINLRGFWSTNDAEMYIGGVFWHANEGDGGKHLRTCATNRHLMGVVDLDVPWPDDAGEEAEVIIYHRTAERIAQMFGDAAEVTVSWNDRLITVTAGATTLTSKLVDAVFVDYGKAYVEEREAIALISAPELGAAAAGLMPLVDGKHHIVRISANKASLVFSISHAETGVEAHRTVPAKVEDWPKDASYSFNGRYLESIAGLFGDTQIRIGIAGVGRAARVDFAERAGDVHGLIVPLRA